MTAVARILAAVLVAIVMTFANQSGASAVRPLADGCAGGSLYEWGGCIHLVGSGDYVVSIRAGVTAGTHDDGGVTCGHYKATLQRLGDDNPKTIHTSALKCPDIGSGKSWGPTWKQDRYYHTGDEFCAFFDAYHPDKRGCVTIYG